MIPGSFDYHRPSSLEEAVALLAEHGEEARPLAGGHSLIPMMKLRLAVPEHLIDLSGVASLKGVCRDGEALVIGAMTTQSELLADAEVAKDLPILQEAAALIADPQVRYCGTVGGNVANGDPGNDLPAIMLCLDATYRLEGPGGRREVKARDFYEGAYFTALGEGEILTAVSIPVPPAGRGQAYEKLKRKVGDYATAAAAAVIGLEGGKCSFASLALTNLGDTPLLAEEAAAALTGSDLGEEAVGKALTAARAIVRPAADGRGSVEYRTHVAGVMLRRAIESAKQRAR